MILCLCFDVLFVCENLPDLARPIECIQRAGEVVFVPHGWWHCVFNIEYTVAITQNYVGTHNLPDVMNFLRTRTGDVSGYGSTCMNGAALSRDFLAALEKVVCCFDGEIVCIFVCTLTCKTFLSLCSKPTGCTKLFHF